MFSILKKIRSKFNGFINRNPKLKAVYTKFKQIHKIMTTQPVYQVTEKELNDTIKECYKRGLSNDQIIQVLYTPPYKWGSMISQIESQNLEDLNAIFDVPYDYYQDVSGENNGYYFDDYQLLNVDDFYGEDLRNIDFSYNSYNQSDNYSDGLQSVDITPQKSDFNSIENVNLQYNISPDRREFISFLIDGFCQSEEFVQSLCAKYPEYASEINAYFKMYVLNENLQNEYDIEASENLKNLNNISYNG